MLFCFGYGYVARFLGGVGTSRSSAGAGKFIYSGGPFPKEILKAIQLSQFLLISIPPNEGEDALVPFIRNSLASFSHLKWIGYLSSTGVYGDHQGKWVDENSPLQPTSTFGVARLRAESQWLQLREDTNLPVHIFRLAGIYGPERNVLNDLKRGNAKRIFKENTTFSRIHIADIVQTLKASMQAPYPGRIYNVADNYPSPSHEVIEYGAKLLGMNPPPLIPYESINLSSLARSFYEASKRISNKRLLDELVPKLLFPSYKEGLNALLNHL